MPKQCKTGECATPTHIIIGVIVVGLAIMVLMYFRSPNGEGYDDNLYENVYTPSNSRSSHPTLKYQRDASYMNTPANWGDPIRYPMLTGPSYGNSEERTHRVGSYKRAYDQGVLSSIGDGGPPTFVGRPIGVPVQNGNLKRTSEVYRGPFYPPFQEPSGSFDGRFSPSGSSIDELRQLGRPLESNDYFRPYGPNNFQDISVADTPFYRRGYVPKSAFFGTSDAYYPFPEVNTPWEKIGILTTVNPSEDTILNLFRRPIAPLQDLFEYTTQDKNGFVIPLERRALIENGDIIERVRGYESKGPWKANVFVNNKYIWV
jgi:hypothetical protein